MTLKPGLPFGLLNSFPEIGDLAIFRHFSDVEENSVF
jgi:hypothetical protein